MTDTQREALSARQILTGCRHEYLSNRVPICMNCIEAALATGETEKQALREQVRVLREAAVPFAAFTDYAEAHPRTGISDDIYGWDNAVAIRLSDLRRLRDAAAIKGATDGQ